MARLENALIRLFAKVVCHVRETGHYGKILSSDDPLNKKIGFVCTECEQCYVVPVLEVRMGSREMRSQADTPQGRIEIARQLGTGSHPELRALAVWHEQRLKT